MSELGLEMLVAEAAIEFVFRRVGEVLIEGLLRREVAVAERAVRHDAYLSFLQVLEMKRKVGSFRGRSFGSEDRIE